MYKVEAEIVINAPVETVFEWVEHPEKHHHWQGSLLGTERTDEGKVVVTRKFLGRKLETHYHEREVVPHRRLRRRGRSAPHMPVRYDVDQIMEFEPVAGGTRIHATVEVDTKGALHALLPLFTRSSKHELAVSLAHLKELVEADDAVHEALGELPLHN